MNVLENSRIAVVWGGVSREREISKRSATNVVAACRRLGHLAEMVDSAGGSGWEKAFDLACIMIHGAGGEDGAIQGYCETVGIPYTGSGIRASAIGIDKWASYAVMDQIGIPHPTSIKVDSTSVTSVPPLPFPVFVKPVREGSSIGAHILRNQSEWDQWMPALVTQFSEMLVEEYIVGTEITVSVISDGGTEIDLPILELHPTHDFYDYAVKYTAGMTDFILPANLDPATTDQCQLWAKRLHQTLGCRGATRTDMLVDPIRGPVVLEINTIPGMTDTSDLPAQAAHGGIPFDELVAMLLRSSQCRD